jgi:hypothetical protein
VEHGNKEPDLRPQDPRNWHIRRARQTLTWVRFRDFAMLTTGSWVPFENFAVRALGQSVEADMATRSMATRSQIRRRLQVVAHPVISFLTRTVAWRIDGIPAASLSRSSIGKASASSVIGGSRQFVLSIRRSLKAATGRIGGGPSSVKFDGVPAAHALLSGPGERVNADIGAADSVPTEMSVKAVNLTTPERCHRHRE